ncbi:MULTISPECIES: DUF445 domain-containing protein [Clostridium]|jgi:uncharacterized membrane protein YheB (UPF0754 family)|uniref:DUF445 family protein n=2 Tax=Clostridium tertium TaxID=1559 RepID=A0A9X4B155_9CLOT|nr:MULTISPECIES: DUF445 family protein [Clostridium]EEH98903.1 hypothetical protein CSBG_02529 [Clostridium sp. 7_2_43FAA]MBS6503693.1 DUF445 family protein [Clostridium sp.]MDB1933686.1 DUF445 family protein [Clostridium tertium]MDB1941943.1 DUF445 family protein [Clostridium tertium]MDB1944373.1 DUF445 family protein [Clostridium tertium]
MNNFITILILTIVGGLIGWITNILAIKLLFRPIKPVKIPILNIEILGLIPKRKNEIAANIGEVISNELLSMDDILDQALNNSNGENFNSYITDKIKNIINEKLNIIPMPFRMMAAPYIDEILNKEVPNAVDEISVDLLDKAKENVNIQEIVEEKINQLDLEKLEDIIIKVAKKELKHIEILGLVLGAIIGVLQGVLVIFL